MSLLSRQRLSVVLRPTTDSWIFISLLVAFMTIWQERVTGRLSLAAAAGFLLYTVLCWVYGRLFLRILPLWIQRAGGAPLRLLGGYLLFNTALFVVILASPFGLMVDLVALSLFAAVTVVVLPAEIEEQQSPHRIPQLLSAALSMVGATFWCADALAPPRTDGQTVTFHLWQDLFVHVRYISAFAQSHGFASLSDIQMAGEPLRFYHYAPYASTAAVSLLTGATAYDVFAGFHLPFGIVLIGLAAYSFASSIWGAWPALAATGAVVLLPDAYQQGLANRYLSYNFLQQVNPGGLYGVAGMAIAWMMMFDGCVKRKHSSILIAYILAGLTVFYKAQIFVANAFLILIYPCLFFAGVRTRWRVLTGVILATLFVAVVTLSQRVSFVPTLRLDGSSGGEYISQLLTDFDPGTVKSFFTRVMFGYGYTRLLRAVYAVGMLSLCTFGAWTLITPSVGLWMKRRAPAPILLFPALIVGNYLTMSLGLAMDPHGIGTKDEFLNRPLVWAFFSVVAWTAGAAYFLAFGDKLPKSGLSRGVLATFAFMALATPLVFSQNLQTFPVRGLVRFEEFNGVPECLVGAATFVRSHSRSEEILQDSEEDFHFAVTGLSERQSFAIKNFFGVEGDRLRDRLNDLSSFKQMSTAADLKSFAARHNISWYILRPESQVMWPDQFRDNSAFTCGRYRVYHFTREQE